MIRQTFSTHICMMLLVLYEHRFMTNIVVIKLIKWKKINLFDKVEKKTLFKWHDKADHSMNKTMNVPSHSIALKERLF